MNMTMTTITIPQNLIREKELIIIPRRNYEDLLRKAVGKTESRDKIWKKLSKKNFLKFYNKTNEIYDQI